MVVRTNMMAMTAYRYLRMNNIALGKSLEKLSSGYRINRAADDPSGLAISEKMRAQIRGLEQAAANAQDGISMVQTAEGATNEIHNILSRMAELATKAANGTIQDEVDREAIENEMNGLRDEITRIAKSTNFNGKNLLDGSQSGSDGGGVRLQIGDTDADYNQVYITIDDLTAKGLGLDGLDFSTQQGAADSLDTIKKAINKVSLNRSSLGSMQNRLEHTIDNLNTTAENLSQADSRIRDTDMAKEMMNYTRLSILTQVAQAMLAQANQHPNIVLQMLKAM